MLINVNMPTTVGILTFMSRINFVLGSVEYEKSFITSGPDILNQLGSRSEFRHGSSSSILL